MYVILTEDVEVLKIALNANAKVFYKANSTSKEYPNGTIPGKLLLDLGIPPHVKGFTFIQYYLEKALNTACMTDMKITKEIYPMIATKFNSTSSSVERTIRHAIHLAQSKNSETWQLLFNSNNNMTNNEFLRRCTLYLKEHI